MTKETMMSDQEHRLRRYVLVLIAWWREIIGGTALIAAGIGTAVLASQLLWPTYGTSADAVIIHAATNVSMDTTIEAAPERNRDRARLMARRAALLGLVHNGSVARAVIERLDGLLSERESTEARLLPKIDAALVVASNSTLRYGSDLIRVTARTDSPEKAAAIADAWTEEYVSHVNRLYSRVPENLVASIAAAVESARRNYVAAQRDLERFTAVTSIDRVSRLIESKKEIVNQLRVLETTTNTASIRAHTELLVDEYATRSKLLQLITAVRSLRTQIELGSEAGSASTGLALALLKVGIHSLSTDPPDSLEIKVDSSAFHADTADQLADVDALLLSLEKQVEQSGMNVERLSENLYGEPTAAVGSGALLAADAGGGSPNSSQRSSRFLDRLRSSVEGGISTPIDSFLSELEDEILDLEVKREAADAERASLVQHRDNMRSALESLEKESVELRLALAAETPQLRVASQAVVPTNHDGLPLLPIVILAAIFGLLTMTCLACFANAMNWHPLLKTGAAR